MLGILNGISHRRIPLFVTHLSTYCLRFCEENKLGAPTIQAWQNKYIQKLKHKIILSDTERFYFEGKRNDCVQHSRRPHWQQLDDSWSGASMLT